MLLLFQKTLQSSSFVESLTSLFMVDFIRCLKPFFFYGEKILSSFYIMKKSKKAKNQFMYNNSVHFTYAQRANAPALLNALHLIISFQLEGLSNILNLQNQYTVNIQDLIIPALFSCFNTIKYYVKKIIGRIRIVGLRP